MSKVIWKDIPNYKGLYQASNDGRIRSFYKKEAKELKQRLSNAGYFRVQLFKNKKGQNCCPVLCILEIFKLEIT